MKKLLEGRCLVLDGGLATELELRGIDLGGPLWSARCLADQPEAIRDVHLDYFRAGADIATTASYQASYPGFARIGLDAKRTTALLHRSVSLAREASEIAEAATGTPRFVAASIGCYGAYLADGSEYRGDYGLSVDQLIDWHRPRLDALIEAEPDLLACETIPCIHEVEALVRLLEDSPIPAWISVSCKDESLLRHGDRILDAVEVANACCPVIAFGVNCTAPDHIEGLVRTLHRHATKTIVAYPNSGEGWDATRKSWVGRASDFGWTAMTRTWRDAGASWIGGCCRTTPATIREMARAFDSL
ncbi:MAG: homocysteine S-methyltransferase [Gemmataceae bacterium]